VLVGGVGAIIRNSVDDRLRSRRQVEDGLQVPLLGTLPMLSYIRRYGRASRRAVLTYGFSNPHSYFSNHVRSIKTEIDIAMLDAKIQCIGVISAFPAEGRSTLACNLAHAFHCAGRKVLLMDCDIRTRSLSKSLAAADQQGLLEMLGAGATCAQAFLTTYPSGLELLPLMTRKPIPNFSDVLGSERMRTTLQDLRQCYDLLLVDLPSTSLGADARAISPQLDALIVVAKYDATPGHVLGELIQSFDRLPPRILGVVLNKFVN
jgi:succinoglycan biosynthesis transport protein ExoP